MERQQSTTIADVLPGPAPSKSTATLYRAWWAVLSTILVAAIFAWAWTSGEEEDKAALPVIALIPEFSLTECDGRTVNLADLLGKVWIADFIYAQCSGPCPTLSARMRSLQSALNDRATEVRLVSFTLDPLRDSPEALASYARRFHADPGMWWFLTNRDEKVMHELVEKGFLQSVFPASGNNPLIHSNYVAIVDRAGHIRAFHDGLDPNSKSLILRDVRKLLREPPPS